MITETTQHNINERIIPGNVIYLIASGSDTIIDDYSIWSFFAKKYVKMGRFSLIIARNDFTMTLMSNNCISTFEMFQFFGDHNGVYITVYPVQYAMEARVHVM